MSSSRERDHIVIIKGIADIQSLVDVPMEYRRLRSGTRISALGLGSGFLRDAGDDVHTIVSKAMDAGVNFMETSM